MSRSLFDPPESTDRRRVLSVTQLNQQLRDVVHERFPSVWVGGEITDLARPRSGHVYLTLKDEQGQLRGVLWRGVASRLTFDLEDGMEVICEGHIDVYPPRGSYQLIIREVEPKGVGSLQLALVKLREQLSREGLFDPQRKRPLPRFPGRVAVVTSPTSAAVRDLLEVQRRRWPGSRVLVVPTRVQGTEAVDGIVRAIQIAQALNPKPDVLVVTRGGGSLEDLWCFNDERVVRAIATSGIPVVSAIGHEIDVTLADLAADVRALTPSEAAERVWPDASEVRGELDGLARLLARLLERKLQMIRAQLDAIAARPVLARPEQGLRDRVRALDEWEFRLNQSLQSRLKQSRQQIVGLAGRLNALSPLAVLGRGYSLTQRRDDQSVIRSIDQAQVGDQIRTRLQSGELISEVRERFGPDADRLGLGSLTKPDDEHHS